MVSPRPGRKLCVLSALSGLLLCPCATARVLELDIERVETAVGQIEGLALRVDWPDGAATGALELRIGRLDTGGLGYRFERLRWRCPLTLDRATQRVECRGALRAESAGRATLAAQWQAGELRLELAAAKGTLAALLPNDDAAPVTLLAERLPAHWLQPLLQSGWEQGKVTAGTFDARLALEQDGAGETRLRGPVGVAALGVDSADGRVAAASLGFAAELDLRLGARPEITIEGKMRGGELLAGPVYLSLPATPIGLALSLRGADAGRWDITRAEWNEPGVFELAASATLDPAAATPLQSLQLDASLPRLATAHPRYLESVLAGLGLAGLSLEGSARGRYELQQGRAVQLDLALDGVTLRDKDARFAVDALEGSLRWSAAPAPVESELRWRSAKVYEVELAPATLALQSSARRLALRAPTAIGVLGGGIELTRFAWQPPDADRGTQLDLALALNDIDLAQLSDALEWPPFRGTVRGRIPGVRYVDEILSLDGTLSAELFDGKLQMQQMSLERPFGVAPTLSADIGFTALDLEPLTGAFGFGTITGRLDGAVRALRLVDWSPVAFDADLHTSPGARGPRRISRRAVNDLTRVGGGGIAAGLQNQVLKLFETFGYARIGLKCRLAENVCHMDGLDSSGDGYTIVEGSGLPRITVIGHQRQVDWPVLVARLKAATEGQAPIVQ
jgi:hypothetical protein